MVQEYTYPKTKWLQLINPTPEEISSLVSKYALDESVAHDIASPTPQQYVEAYNGFTYAIFHIPAYKHSHSRSHIQEVDFIIGNDFVITIQFDTIDALERLSKEADVTSTLQQETAEDLTAPLIFLQIMERLYESVDNEIGHLQSTLKDIEDKIYTGHEKEMVFELSRANRDLLDIKRTIIPHEVNFDNRFLLATKTKNKEFLERTRHLYEKEYKKTRANLLHSIELANTLRETNDSLLFTKQNEIMKVLTIISFVTFPLSLIASLFGMNTKVLPVVGIDNDFWIITGSMVIATVIMFVLFKFKRWL